MSCMKKCCGSGSIRSEKESLIGSIGTHSTTLGQQGNLTPSLETTSSAFVLSPTSISSTPSSASFSTSTSTALSFVASSSIISSSTASSTSTAEMTFYRRKLPETCISFSSDEGRKLFRRALENGTAEAFYFLIEQYHTQNDPAFCGLGTLTMILNALNVDPGRVWKGGWRWFSEELLDCCVDLDFVRKNGITFQEFICIARCNGAKAQGFRDGMPALTFSSQNNSAEQNNVGSLDLFRKHVLNSCQARCQLSAGCTFGFISVSYDRQVLQQTGSGHFSPIGAFCAAHDQYPDMVLVLDVARFKYPPHWVPLELLYKAMNTIDPATNQKRGWVILSRSDDKILNTTSFISISPSASIEPIRGALNSVRSKLKKLISHQDEMFKESIIESSRILASFISSYITFSETMNQTYEKIQELQGQAIEETTQNSPNNDQNAQNAEIDPSAYEIIKSLRQTEIYDILSSEFPDSEKLRLLHTIILILWRKLLADIDPDFKKDSIIQMEIEKLRLQFEALQCFSLSCSSSCSSSCK